MSVQVINITIEQGADFEQTFFLQDIQRRPYNLTGYTGSSSIKKHPASISSTKDFIFKFINPSNGHITIEMRSVTTKQLKPGRYCYDIIVSGENGKVVRVVEGSVLVTEGISIGCSPEYPFKFGGIPFTPQDTTSEYLNSVGTNWNIIKNITLEDINAYGVLVLGYFNTCGSLENFLDYFSEEYNLNELKYYLQGGGVLWFRGEANPSCGDRDRSNQFLESLGCSIRIGDLDTNTITSGLDPATSIIQIQNALLPSTLQVKQTSNIENGTSLYKVGEYTTFAYEKTSDGLIVVNGDADTFFGVSGPDDNFYQGLRSLV
jgi:hypothetical protein